MWWITDFRGQPMSQNYTEGVRSPVIFVRQTPIYLRPPSFTGSGPRATARPARANNSWICTIYTGDELGPYAGRIRKAEELPPMCSKFGEFRVYVVEVCPDCHWNYLIRAFSLGDGTPRRAVPAFKGDDLLD